MGLVSGTPAAGFQQYQYSQGWDTNRRKLLFAYLGILPPLRGLTWLGTGLGGLQSAAFRMNIIRGAFQWMGKGDRAVRDIGIIGGFDSIFDGLSGYFSMR